MNLCFCWRRPRLKHYRFGWGLRRKEIGSQCITASFSFCFLYLLCSWKTMAPKVAVIVHVNTAPPTATAAAAAAETIDIHLQLRFSHADGANSNTDVDASPSPTVTLLRNSSEGTTTAAVSYSDGPTLPIQSGKQSGPDSQSTEVNDECMECMDCLAEHMLASGIDRQPTKVKNDGAGITGSREDLNDCSPSQAPSLQACWECMSFDAMEDVQHTNYQNRFQRMREIDLELEQWISSASHQAHWSMSCNDKPK